MKITYDSGADAAYIHLSSIQPGGVAKTYTCDPIETDSMINLDFDVEGRLVGIDVMSASKVLPPEVLKNAEIIG
jgi:uncharacterized protein YuzE